MTQLITIDTLKAIDRANNPELFTSDDQRMVAKAVRTTPDDTDDVFDMMEQPGIKNAPVPHGLLATIAREFANAITRVNARLAKVERSSGSILDSKFRGMEITPQTETIKTMQIQIRNLEHRTNGVCFWGEYNPRVLYTREACVQYRGSLFVCKQLKTTSTPGTDDTWVLALRGVNTTTTEGGDGADPSRLDALERRIAELESQQLHDAGVWKTGHTYEKNALVSYDGSAWICSQAHAATGRTIDHEKFRLLVMRGPKGERGDAR